MNTKRKIAVRKLLSGVLVLLALLLVTAMVPVMSYVNMGLLGGLSGERKSTWPNRKPIKGIQVVVRTWMLFCEGQEDYVSDYDTVYTDVKVSSRWQGAYFQHRQSGSAFPWCGWRGRMGRIWICYSRVDQMEKSQIKRRKLACRSLYELKAEVKLSSRRRNNPKTKLNYPFYSIMRAVADLTCPALPLDFCNWWLLPNGWTLLVHWVEICNGSCHFQDTVVGTSRQVGVVSWHCAVDWALFIGFGI